MNNDKYTKESEEIIEKIQEIRRSIDYIEQSIRDAKEEYEIDSRLEKRFQLDSAIFLYNKYLKNKIEIVSTGDQRDRKYTDRSIDGQSFKIGLDESWRASDFQDLFESINTIYEFSAASQVVKTRELPDYGRIQSDKRMRQSYRRGSLDHILEKDGKLNVVKVQYNSPGEVEFISLIAEHAPSIIQTVLVSLAIVKYAPTFCKELPRIYRTWIQEKVRARELQRQDRRNALIQDFFERTFPIVMNRDLLPQLTNEQNPEEIEGLLNTINNNIQRISESEVTDSINSTQELFKSYSKLASMYLGGQIEFPDDI